MKKTLLITAFFMLVSIFSFAQVTTDIQVVNALIGRPYIELNNIFKEYNLEYYITSEDGSKTTIYVSKNNSVRLWEIKHKDLMREYGPSNQKVLKLAGKDLVIEIFIRYRHSNLNDLREFHSYNIPENTKYREYEKSYGEKLSHLRVTQK